MKLLAAGMTLLLLGGGIFGAGIGLSMQPLMITGIAIIGVAFLIFIALCFVKRDPPPPTNNPIREYRSNSMKRNKSDTDLELMRQEEPVV